MIKFEDKVKCSVLWARFMGKIYVYAIRLRFKLNV
jgi:hypothetical protein